MVGPAKCALLFIKCMVGWKNVACQQKQAFTHRQYAHNYLENYYVYMNNWTVCDWHPLGTDYYGVMEGVTDHDIWRFH
jgi:hypothetical protein